MPDNQADPLVSAWFGVEFQGAVVGAFRECSGLGSEHEVVRHLASGPDGKQVTQVLPGRLKWNDITLKRGITDSMDMWKWRKQVEDGDITGARKNGTITMFTAKGDAIAKWDFVRAWPNKLVGPTANAANNEVAIEELHITHEGYKRTQ